MAVCAGDGQQDSQTLLRAHLDAKMNDAFAVDARDTARQLKCETPKLVVVLNALARYDASFERARDELDDCEDYFGGRTVAEN